MYYFVECQTHSLSHLCVRLAISLIFLAILKVCTIQRVRNASLFIQMDRLLKNKSVVSESAINANSNEFIPSYSKQIEFYDRFYYAPLPWKIDHLRFRKRRRSFNKPTDNPVVNICPTHQVAVDDRNAIKAHLICFLQD